MKKIVSIFALCVCVFILTGMKNTKDYASEAWVTEHFGNKFVSAQELGLGELPILFTEAELKYDQTSFMIPLERNGIMAYYLVQRRCIRNESEPNDTLSLRETEAVIQALKKTGREFSNEKFQFFKTKEVFSVNGVEYAKTVMLNQKNCSVIDLPSNVSVIIVGQESNAYSYVSDIKGGITISIDSNNFFKSREELLGASVMTLISLSPSQ